MPIVDENRLKGNWAANLVASELSAAGCLVRPVTADTDVGVDLYCETTEQMHASCQSHQREPFLHFWMQVRSGKQCVVRDDRERARHRVRTDQFVYWARQPVPVFVALVPAENRADPVDRIYLVDISRYVVEGVIDVPIDGKVPATLELESELFLRLGNENDRQELIGTAIPMSHARLFARYGIIAEVPQVRPTYVRERPLIPADRYASQILNQIRCTAALSIVCIRAAGRLGIQPKPQFAKLCARILEAFDYDDHYETFFAQGLAAHVNGAHDAAIKHYEHALAIIDRDATLPPASAINTIIRQDIVRCREAAADRVLLPPAP